MAAAGQKGAGFHVSFEPKFAKTLVAFSIEAACWQEAAFYVVDAQGKEIYGAPCTKRGIVPLQQYPHHFEVKSQSGIGGFGFRGTSLPGNTAIDNVQVTRRSRE